MEQFQSDPHWCDLILFYASFHGYNARGHRSLVVCLIPINWQASERRLTELYAEYAYLRDRTED